MERVASASNDRPDTVRLGIRDNAAFSPAYVIMNSLSAVIASYGLLLGSTAVVIGAMIVALLLGPIMGIALALVDADNALLKKSLVAEMGGVIIVFSISLMIGAIYWDVPVGATIILRTSPNIMDLAIALVGGAAGAYATISPRVSASIVGVAVATALVPPLCVSGITLARGNLQMALGSFLLFVVNLVAIQFASSLVFWLHGYHTMLTLTTTDRKTMLLRHGPSAIILAVLTIVLLINFSESLTARKYEIQVRKIITEQLRFRPGSYLADLRIDRERSHIAVTAVVRTPFSIGPERVSSIQSKLPKQDVPAELHLRSILTTEASAKTWLHEAPAASQAGAELGGGN